MNPSKPTTAMLGLLKQHSYIRSLLSPLRTTITSSIYHHHLLLLSTATATATQPTSPPSPTSDFAIQYLTNSCGLPFDKAARASRYLLHLKSPEKPDAVLRFLQQAGITEPHIRAAASRYPGFLTWSVEKCLKPKIVGLKEIGFSPSHISLLFSINPTAFKLTELTQKIKFWLSIFSSPEKLLIAFRYNMFLLTNNFETSLVPNLSFLREQCHLSVCQIARLILLAPRLVSSRPESLKILAKRADDLGVPRASGMFMYALIVVSSLNQRSIDAKVQCLKSHGLSQEEVILIISKHPFLLKNSENMLGCKMEFLIKEMGCDKLCLVRNPACLSMSLEKRLMPRCRVKKLLESKGLPVGSKAFASFMNPSEKDFKEKFVMPYEHSIPGLNQAYADMCAGKIAAVEWFKNNSS